VDALGEIIEARTEEEQGKLLSENAVRFYKL
jgi:predicted TIM-barrel fold metal-dependent hydrolase